MFISPAFAAAPVAANASPNGSMMSLLPMIGIFVVFWFLMIRPQMKKQKEHRAMVEALGKGDPVICSGGIYGKITKLEEQILHVEIAEGVEIRIQRAAVTQVLPKGSV